MLQSNSKFDVGHFRPEAHFLTRGAPRAVGGKRGEERNWECASSFAQSVLCTSAYEFQSEVLYCTNLLKQNA